MEWLCEQQGLVGGDEGDASAPCLDQRAKPLLALAAGLFRTGLLGARAPQVEGAHHGGAHPLEVVLHDVVRGARLDVFRRGLLVEAAVTTITGRLRRLEQRDAQRIGGSERGSEWSVRMMSGRRSAEPPGTPARNRPGRRARDTRAAAAHARPGAAIVRDVFLPSGPARSPDIVSVRLLVQRAASTADLETARRERLEVHGLDDVAVGTQAICRRDVRLLFGRSEHDYRSLRVRSSPLSAAGPPARPLSELEVEQDHRAGDADLA